MTTERKFNLGSQTLIVTYTKTESIVKKWLADHIIQKAEMIGFDTESKPQFKKGMPRNKIATIQLAVPSGHCLVYHIIKDKNAQHELLQKVLQDSKITKVGVGIGSDSHSLKTDYSLSLNSVLDIGAIVKAYVGMVKDMYHSSGDSTSILSEEELKVLDPSEKRAMELDLIEKVYNFAASLNILYFDKIGIAGISKGLGIPFEKSKKVTLSDWEKAHLNVSQLHYAAADSWVVTAAHDKILQQLSDYSFPRHHVSKILSLFNM